MSNFPRRSPRLNQQPQNTYTQQGVGSIPAFPAFSQTSSVSTTSHPSPTNGNIPLSGQGQQYSQFTNPQFLAPAQSYGVPLPSPSTNDINPFFGRSQYYEQTMGGQSQQDNSSNVSVQQQEDQQLQHQQHHNSISQPQRPNYPPTNVAGVPPGLPADFLAEAAKRAQMACLMRDMDDVTL